MEWRSVVFSDESRFCLYTSDGRKCVRRRPGERHCLECITHDTQAPPQASWCGAAISYHSRSHLVFLQCNEKHCRYIAQVVNPVLLPFRLQEGDVLFQQDNARPHTAAATQRTLRGVQ